MVILRQFLKLLELLEQVVNFLAAPIGCSAGLCFISYQILLLSGCDAPTSAILASTIALTLYCIVQQPDI
ncbi:MAG: hypothetical protein F6K19_17020 [Cyanothece sp. SIO1E1]|nr:hypothetical protein [Cyanothece sp. SIO1E1]